jgi:hypothetical protein
MDEARVIEIDAIPGGGGPVAISGFGVSVVVQAKSEKTNAIASKRVANRPPTLPKLTPRIPMALPRTEH